ncbi:MAG: hypothetical protein ISR87_07820 [Candidatus Marinimicrobia bacterium]|nr:hypothetical protein [FCB group bacterium]MBL7025351.1 hypothetical protein [Candidatus Neomarinimicrobiota bacterium]
MRNIYLILLVAGLSSCGLSPNADPTARHASRRAHSGKYIIEQTHVAGSRNLFVQPDGMNCLNSSKAVSEYLNTHHRDRNRDAVLIILLDKKNQVIDMNELGPEVLSTPSIYMSEVTQKATDHKAASVILVQCLPSRSSTPYKNDREISKNLKQALETIDVDLLDHLIVGRTQCFSFADNQLL